MSHKDVQGREGSIMGVSHIVVKKGVDSGRMCRFWEGRISQGGIFWEGGVHTESIAYSCRKGGYILERWGKFWEPHLI